MANLKSIAELVYNQLFPSPNDETSIDLEDFIETAKNEYAYQWWLKALNEKNSEGYFEVPSYLLTQKVLKVEKDVMDISSLEILKGLPGEIWLQGIGGSDCKCKYVKTTYNRARILCDDDSLADDTKTFYPIDKKIVFPRGVHASELEITYANKGEDVDDEIEVDDVIGGVIRRTLYDLYKDKSPVDKTNNSNPNG